MFNLIIFCRGFITNPLLQHRVDDVNLINRKDSGARSEENEPLNIRLRQEAFWIHQMHLPQRLFEEDPKFTLVLLKTCSHIHCNRRSCSSCHAVLTIRGRGCTNVKFISSNNAEFHTPRSIYILQENLQHRHESTDPSTMIDHDATMYVGTLKCEDP